MRVLVVDDDAVFCRFLMEVLQDKGMDVVCTTNGLDAYDLLNREPCDVSIIDVRMPLVLGTELADAISQDHPEAKMILASAFADQALQDYAKRKGILLLSKPFTAKQLIEAVQLTVGFSIGRNQSKDG